MPMIDLTASAGADIPALRDCDVCIVGTGPAGATLAAELRNSRLRVTILESGGIDRSDVSDRLNDAENIGHARIDSWAARNRILGGSSHTWGGRCAPFDEIDYEYRSWVPASGWPIGPDDLAPYLERSASHLGLAVGTDFSGDEFWGVAGRDRPGANPDPSALRPFFWQFSRDENGSYPFEHLRFGRGLPSRLGPDITLVTGATVLRIEPDASGHSVESVSFSGPEGPESSLRAKVVVLAAGAVENARLLLNSTTVTPAGLGNDHDLVGRYLMDHLRGPSASFDVGSAGELLKRLGRYNVRGRLFRAGFRLSPDLQRAEGLLNCSAWLGEGLGADDPWDALRRILRGSPELPGDVVAVAKGAPLFARGVRSYFVERNGIPRNFESISLLTMVEQLPDPDSRVSLSDRRDAFGQRLPRVDWRVHPEEARTMRRMTEVVVEQLAAMGYPAPTPHDWVRDGGELPADFLDVAHATGTTRMSLTPETGVVDPQGQVHGVAGLYVAGSSTFPTAGHCNPTQMIVALAIRLADHLKADHATSAVDDSAQPDALGRVLVTGGTGRIGRVVVDDLLTRGYQVRATTSRSPGPAARPGLEWRVFDLMGRRAADYDELIAGCVAVINLAAEIGDPERMTELNVEAPRLLAEAAERASLEAFVHTSSVAVYGSGRTRNMTEDSPTLTAEEDIPAEYLAVENLRAYGRTKMAGEAAINEVAQTVRYTVLRPTVVVEEAAIMAIRDWNPIKRILAAHRHSHYVYVRDVSDVIVWSLERSLDGAGSPGEVATYNVSEDDRPAPTHAAFLRQAFEATGDSTFKVPTVPGVLDWMQDLVRFRRLTRRNPLWRMRFPADRLEAAGFQRRWGMRYAETRALEQLRQRSTGPVDIRALQGADA